MRFLKQIIFAIGFIFSVIANAEAGPPIEYVIYFSPGGPSDMISRSMLKYLPSDYYASNRPGAGGKIAINHLTRTNGLMLATMNQIYVSNTLMNTKQEYHPDDDLEVIASIGDMPSILVCKKSLGFQSFNDIKTTTKSLSFGISGYGSSEHFGTELLLKKLKNDHIIVPYPAGGSSSVIDLLGGNIDCIFANYPRIKEFQSHPALTFLLSSVNIGIDVATWKNAFNEPFPFTSYLAIVIPRAMSASMRKTIILDVNHAIKSQGFVNDLVNIGIFPIIGSDQASIKRVMDNNTKLFNLIKQNDLRFQ